MLFRSWDLGYRYQTGTVILSSALWSKDYQNRIVSSFDQNCNCFIDRNIGDVKQWGWDGEAGIRLTDAFSVYGSLSYNNSEVQGDLPARATIVNVNGGAPLPQPPSATNTYETVLPTKGNKLVETPDWTFGGRAQYEAGNWRIGVQAKYVGERYSTDLNDEKVDAYTLVDTDIQYDLAGLGFEGSYLQLNVLNMFDQDWIGSISSTNNAQVFFDPSFTPTAGLCGGVALADCKGRISNSAPTYAIGYPRTLMLTLRAKF